jgi:hypothetical protein
MPTPQHANITPTQHHASASLPTYAASKYDVLPTPNPASKYDILPTQQHANVGVPAQAAFTCDVLPIQQHANVGVPAHVAKSPCMIFDKNRHMHAVTEGDVGIVVVVETGAKGFALRVCDMHPDSPAEVGRQFVCVCVCVRWVSWLWSKLVVGR